MGPCSKFMQKLVVTIDITPKTGIIMVVIINVTTSK